MSVKKIVPSTFTQKFNALTGSLEWSFVDQEYDFVQEIARSDYGDMLWDSERNQLYEKAISKYITRLLRTKPKDELIKVIDIGTGTGLLSMMVCRSMGSDLSRLAINAYECFTPMAECASKITQDNGYSKIKIINKRSDQHELPQGEKADLLVTEVFDTELIGEGALGVFNWALKNQLSSNPLVIPHKARVWVQLISSPMLIKSHKFVQQKYHLVNHDVSLKIPEQVMKCPGSDHLFDLQASALNFNTKLVSKPEIAFTFVFSDPKTLKNYDSVSLNMSITESVETDDLVVLFWWDLFMDDDEEFLLSCAPYWAHPLSLAKDKLPWRNHWMQAIYYLPANTKSLNLQRGEKLNLNCYRDQFSYWFDLNPIRSYSKSPSPCVCRIHQNLSRNRLLLLNDEERTSKMLKGILRKVGNFKNQNILFVGDSSLLPILVSKSIDSSNRVYCMHNDRVPNSLFFEIFAEANGVDQTMQVLSNLEKAFGMRYSAVISEPFFSHAILPWDNLHFWFIIDQLVENNCIDEKSFIFPNRAYLKALPISFHHLHKTQAKVGIVEGFNMKRFDDLIGQARRRTDAIIQAEPLWEFANNPISTDTLTLFEWNFQKERLKSTENGTEEEFIISENSRANNINLAFWTEFEFDGEKVSGGPIVEKNSDKPIQWPKTKDQAVAFLYPEFQAYNLPCKIKFSLRYLHESGVMDLKYFFEKI